jgi:hypothetical protein
MNNNKEYYRVRVIVINATISVILWRKPKKTTSLTRLIMSANHVD